MEGTHTGGYAYDHYLFEKSAEMPFPLVHPATVERDVEADRLYELRSFAWLPRILTVVGAKLGAFGRAVADSAHPLERAFPALFRL